MKKRNLLRPSILLLAALAASPAFAQAFNPGDLVISTVSDSDPGATNSGLDTAAPIVLDEFALSNSGATATADGSLVLPQVTVGDQSAISGEYGSASEGILQDSVNGQYLTMMGYGVTAADFNAQLNDYGTTALGQTTSLTAAEQNGTNYTTVPRVVALIGANGSVDTSTALTGVFNENNPRSVATVDGTSFYVSGQGATEGDPTEGVFYATLGSTTATAIDNSTDTRVVSIINNGGGNELYVSRDLNPSGSGGQNFTNISTLTTAGGALPTSSAGVTTTHIIPPASPDSLGGNNGSINVTAANSNGINSSRIGSFVYLSPEQYFMASSTVMYVTDSGEPKNGSSGKAGLGEGGLQKWDLIDGTWTLQYDLTQGLNLVSNVGANSATPTAAGVTGLFGLTGEVVGDNVELFATSYGLNELSPSYLYEITDDLDATTSAEVAGESFTTLDSAASGTSIRGVAFAPEDVPEPSTFPLMLPMLLGTLGFLGHRARRSIA